MIVVRFPTLRVVPLDQCLLHEDVDGARVSRLQARLAADGLLRNPPILGRHDGLDQLIVLDGATRTTALRALGKRHVVAQVVDYDDEAIQLHTWSHVLTGLDLDDLVAALAGDPALAARSCTPYEAENALAASLLAESEAPEIAARYEANTQQALAAGVFGAPSYVVEGEIFWGQDRLEFLERRLRG